MIDPALERRYADCQELVEAWRSFLEFYNVAVKSPEQINPQNEQGFLNAKARVAMLHDSFMDSLERDRQTGANMLGLINRSITLRHLNKMGAADHKKMEIEWHEVYLLLSDTVTALEEERTRLAGISQSSHNMKKMQERAVATLKAFLHSIYFKIIVFVAILAALSSSIFIFEDELRTADWSRKHFPKVLAFERNVLGLDAPYSDVTEYTSKAFGTRDPRPEGIESWNDANLTKDSIGNMLGAQVSPSLREPANKATSGTAYSITLAGAPPGRPPIIGLLCFYSVGEASMFESTFRTENNKPNTQFEVARKGNIVFVILASDPSTRGRIKAAFVDSVN